MKNSKSKTPSVSFVLKKISDDKSLALFNSIAIADGDKYIALKEMNLSSKQYYSRISGLMDAGLIKKHQSFSLTSFGKVVYNSQMRISKALSYYWKLKAIESFQISAPHSELPEQEMAKIINALIDNYQIKDTLMNSLNIAVKDVEKL
jgi:predicted transcriptional regulator